jgi:hypothetical protein
MRQRAAAQRLIWIKRLARRPAIEPHNAQDCDKPFDCGRAAQ